MFLEYYGLREQPFGVTPDPRYLYFSSTHREALASLFYGIETDRGFLTLIAPPGMGKTTLLFHLLERLRGAAHTAFLFQTQCDSRELFQYLLTDLGIAVGNQNLASMHEQLNEKLLSVARAGKRFVLVIDEAQNLEDSVLETVRLLSDLETTQTKLMQIVLSGQPQLADKLSRPGLAQLRQRISIVSRLEPFTPAETMVYIDHRLRIAGYTGGPLFTFNALAVISAESGGIPRNINNLCFNSLSQGYAQRQKKIDSSIVQGVLSDLSLDLLGSQRTAIRHIVPGPPQALAGPTGDGDTARDGLQAAARAAWKSKPLITSEVTTDAHPVRVKPETPVAQATVSTQEQDLVLAVRPVSPVALPGSMAASGLSVQSQKTNKANHANPPTVFSESQGSSGPACPSEPRALRDGSGRVSAPDEDFRSSSVRHKRADRQQGEVAGGASLPNSSMPAEGAEASRASKQKQGRDGSARARHMLSAISQAFSRRPSVSMRSNPRTSLARVTLRSASLVSGIVLLGAFALLFQVRHGARTHATTEAVPPQTIQAVPTTIDMTNSTDRPQAVQTRGAPEPVASDTASPKTLKRVFAQARKLVAAIAIPRKVVMSKEEELPPDVSAVDVLGKVPGGVPGGQGDGVIAGIISGAQKTYVPMAPTAPQPKAPIRVGGRIKPPRPVSTPEPVYPALARQTKIRGDVLINAVLDPKGNVMEMRVVSGHPLLIPAAMEALHKWKYEPTYLNDEPVAVQLIVTIRFQLNN